MNPGSTQIALNATSNMSDPSQQVQKDLVDDSKGNINGTRNKIAGGKGKHLTRSHAMRESTSPPRTPTPRADMQSNNASEMQSPISDTRLHVHATPSLLDTLSSPNLSQKQISPNESSGKSQLDLDFPKLTPPKSSFNNNNNSNNNLNNKSNNSNGRNNNNSNTNNNSGKSDTAAEKTNEQMNKADIKSSASHITIQQPQNLNENYHLISNSCHNTSNKHNNHNNNNSPYDKELNVNVCSENIDHKNSSLSGPSTNQASSSLLVVTSSSHMTSQMSSSNQALSPNPASPATNNIYCDKREVNYNNSNNSNNQINIQLSHDDGRYGQCDSPDSLMRNNSKKHRNSAAAVGLKNQKSGSSFDKSSGGGGNGPGCNSGFMSRNNSMEQFTDQSGVDLIQFFRETLNKNQKDRNMLMKIEKELLALAMDRSRNQYKFPAMSSYNRMLIHRVAAYFGMEHNVDATQQSVIVAITQQTRVPEIRFKTLIKDTFSEEPRKSILKRDTHSFDEYQRYLNPERGVLDRKAKSFEEREEEYEKVKRRIFKNREAHSFGGYGGGSQSAALLRGDSITSTKSAGARLFSKQDSNASTNTPWRLSPSSSGYKTQSIRSDSVTPSPTYGSGDHTPEPCTQSPATSCGFMWAVSDMASIPKGSVLIDPTTLQPIVNQDGSIYHFDPSNLPATANISGKSHKKKFEKQKSIKGNEGSMDQHQSTTTTIAEEGIEISFMSNEKLGTKDEIEDNSSLINEELSKVNSNIQCNELTIGKQQKHQATSPLMPASEMQPLDMSDINDQADDNTDAATVIQEDIENDKCDEQNHILDDNTQDQNSKKDDANMKSNAVVQSVPSNNYATSTIPNNASGTVGAYNHYDSGNAGATIYTPALACPAPSSMPTYQDGAIYAVPSPLVYTYPTTIESDIPGYFVPVYDQQRDPSMATQIYQAPQTPASVLPIAYAPAAAYGNTPMYQNSVVYSPEQFSAVSAGTTAAGQIQQYPISYPIGYSYPINGAATYQNYWNQPVTYYVPQSSVPSTGSTPIIMLKQSPGLSQQHQEILGQQSNQESQMANNQLQQSHHPITPQQPNPQIYSNVIPFTGHSVAYHTQTVSNAPPETPGANSNIYQTSNSIATPQSTPSTPLSLPLPLPPHSKNPPLFATPPNLPNGTVIQHHNHGQNVDDRKTNNGSYQNKRQNNNNNNFYNSNNNNNSNGNGSRQMTPNNFTISGPRHQYHNNNNGSNTGSNNSMPQHHHQQQQHQQSLQQPPKQHRVDNKPPLIRPAMPLISTLPTHHTGNINNYGDKNRLNRSSKPANLDLKRNFNNVNRNTPSTNSTESNNSPNSISSNTAPPEHHNPVQHYHHPQHQPQPVPTTSNQHQHPQPYYMARAGSVGHSTATVAQISTPVTEQFHQPLISTYPATGMSYVKFGQTYFTHPSIAALPQNRCSPPNEIRPITGVYPSMNMMVPASRHMTPRTQNYNKNKAQR